MHAKKENRQQTPRDKRRGGESKELAQVMFTEGL